MPAPPPAAAMAPFSPLPWRKHAPSRIIEDANGAFVASITLSPDGADDLIVTAVNSHAALLAALIVAERVVRSVDRGGLKSCGQELQQIHDAIDRARGDAPGTYEEKEYG